MTVLFDRTVQHQGWFGGTFATGQWDDPTAPLLTGLSARSFWVASLNGNAIDISLGFTDSAGHRTSPIWVNQHTSGALQGLTIPSPQLITPSTYVDITTRVPQANQVALARFVVTDQADTPPPTTPPCQYGTRPQVTVPPSLILTAEGISGILVAAGFPELAVLFTPLIGLTLAISSLCSQQPPVFPALGPNVTDNSPGELLQALESLAWSQFCECVPGTPAPVPFPPPTVVVPPGIPAPPSFPCDPANLCASIARIETLLNQVAGTLGSNYALTTLLQRYTVPFGVVPGAFHTGLTGVGSVSVGRLIGLSYQVDELPAGARVTPGVTDYIRDLGWVGFTLPSGAVMEHRVTRQQELWMPDDVEMATQIGWSLTPGTSITIRELAAEQ